MSKDISMIKIDDYMKVLTVRMIRDTVILNSPLSLRELCELVSVDPDSKGVLEIRDSLHQLEDSGEIEFDYEHGVYKSKLVLR